MSFHFLLLLGMFSSLRAKGESVCSWDSLTRWEQFVFAITSAWAEIGPGARTHGLMMSEWVAKVRQLPGGSRIYIEQRILDSFS